MKEFKVGDFNFRIKKMNAIELLALKSQISFDSYEVAEECYNTLLTKIEVQVKDQWIPVKQGDNYRPVDIENDFDTISTLIMNIITYLKEVFQKSNALNNETE